MSYLQRLCPITMVRVARRTVLDCGSSTLEALIFIRAALWWLLLWLTDERVFRATTLLQVIAVVTKPLYLWWCGIGLVLFIAAYVAQLRVLHLAALLYAVFWWLSQAYILWRLAPDSVSAADVTVSGVMAALAFWWLLLHPARRAHA